MVTLNRRSAVLAALVAGRWRANRRPLVPAAFAQDATRAAKAEQPPDDKRWQAVAPGRVEPSSGEIKIAAPMIGTVGEVLVKANDKVFAGEPLIRLVDTEAQARMATAEAQVALRRARAQRRERVAAGSDRRRAEDAVFDGEKAVIDARGAVDRAAIERRAGRMSDAELDRRAHDADARAGPAQAAQGRSAPRRERQRHAVSDPGGRPAHHRAHRTGSRRGRAARR